LLFPRCAQDPAAFPLGSGGDPAGKRSQIANGRKVVRQSQPDALADVLGISPAQPVSAADGPDQRGVPLDEVVPCLPITGSGTCHQGGEVIVHHGRVLSLYALRRS
jgi:hypothetical protein